MAAAGSGTCGSGSPNEGQPLMRGLHGEEAGTSHHRVAVIQHTKMTLKAWLRQIDVLVYLLVMVFAIASWIDINGVWVEIPLLVNELPESWNLPSYLVIIIQVANVGPLAFAAANRISPTRVKEWPVIYLIIAIGCIAIILMAFLWDQTTFIRGTEHSTALLSLTSLLALVDCTSSVVFLPYMAFFKPQYMTAFFIGEGMSGLVPGVIGLIQGVGGDPDCVNSSRTIFNETTGINQTIWEVWPVYPPPRFSIQVFFIILFVLLCSSAVAFTCLHFLPYCQKEKINLESTTTAVNAAQILSIKSVGEEAELAESDRSLRSNGVDDDSFYDNPGSRQKVLEITKEPDELVTEKSDLNAAKKGLTFQQFAFLLGLTAWMNGLTNGVLPSTQSYSALPYSNMVYNLAVRLGTLANPLACFLALFISTKSIAAITTLTGIGTIFSAYQLYLAALSPTPILQGEAAGDFLCIITSILLTACFSYTKVCIGYLFQIEGKKALLWCGIFQQVGSCIGAVITFVLVNVVQVFKDSYPCT